MSGTHGGFKRFRCCSPASLFCLCCMLATFATQLTAGELLDAAHFETAAEVAAALAAHPDQLMLRDADGNTPLHLAAMRGDMSVVQPLVQAGAPLNLHNHAGNTPINCTKNIDVLNYLMQQPHYYDWQEIDYERRYYRKSLSAVMYWKDLGHAPLMLIGLWLLLAIGGVIAVFWLKSRYQRRAALKQSTASAASGPDALGGGDEPAWSAPAVAPDSPREMARAQAAERLVRLRRPLPFSVLLALPLWLVHFYDPFLIDQTGTAGMILSLAVVVVLEATIVLLHQPQALWRRWGAKIGMGAAALSGMWMWVLLETVGDEYNAGLTSMLASGAGIGLVIYFYHVVQIMLLEEKMHSKEQLVQRQRRFKPREELKVEPGWDEAHRPAERTPASPTPPPAEAHAAATIEPSLKADQKE